MKYLKVGEVAAILGVSTQTLRTWDNDGTFEADRKTSGGTRMYYDGNVKHKLRSMTGTPVMKFHNQIRDIMVIIEEMKESEYYKETIE